MRDLLQSECKTIFKFETTGVNRSTLSFSFASALNTWMVSLGFPFEHKRQIFTFQGDADM